jgi:hypothetical protein
MGKKTRNRACPAAGREITAFECGSGRHTTYACPEQCPFNPFSAANYDEFRRIEWAAEKKLFEWMLATMPDRAEFNLGLERVMGKGPNTRYFHYMAWHSVFQLGPDGDSCTGKWAKAGFPGLSADERVFLRGRSQMRPAMIEVHRVLDGKAASRAEDPPYDKALVPPALLKDPPKLVFTVSRELAPVQPSSPGTMAADFERQRDREFLEAPIAALEGKTPRQAASDPAFREGLRRLIKSRISATDKHNLETGRNDDINWLVRELGLDEILFEPPPLRPRLGPGPGRQDA